MAQFFKIHPDNPQQRLITQSIAIIRLGGVIAISYRFLLRTGLSNWHKISSGSNVADTWTESWASFNYYMS